MLVPVSNSSVFRDSETGRIINPGEWLTFESSDHAEGTKLNLVLDGSYLFGWRFSCAKWPEPKEMQQLVQLWVDDKLLSEVVLASILSLPGDAASRDHRSLDKFHESTFISKDSRVVVHLVERPVEGAGLRVHFHGWKQRKIIK